MKKTRVVFYARVSKDTEEQLHSFEAQKKYFEEFFLSRLTDAEKFAIIILASSLSGA